MSEMPSPTVAPRSSKGGWVAVLFTFLVTWEGVQHVARHDPIDPAGIITVCAGRTNYDDPKLRAGQRYTDADCERFLEQDIPKYVAPLRKCIPTFDLQPPYRKVALASAAYNLGPARVCKSIAPDLNAGRIAKACDDLLQFTHAAGKYVRGLDRRRHAERTLCLMETLDVKNGR